MSYRTHSAHITQGKAHVQSIVPWIKDTKHVLRDEDTRKLKKSVCRVGITWSNSVSAGYVCATLFFSLNFS